MLKTSMQGTLLAVLCCLPVITGATCRAGSAAEAGRDQGYSQAKQAAQDWADREHSASDSLQDCLSRIRTTSLVVPDFPNLQDIVDQLAEKVCKAATDKANDYIPDTLDPWGDYTGK